MERKRGLILHACFVPLAYGRAALMHRVALLAVLACVGSALTGLGLRDAAARSQLSAQEAGWAAGLPGVTLGHGGGVAAPSDPPSRRGALGGREGTAKPAGELLPELSTATSRTYGLERGGLITRLFAEPVNFRGPGGEWRAIDNDLVPAPGGFTNAANSYRVFVPESADQATIVRRDGEWLASRLVGARGQAQTEGPTATFHDVLSGVSSRYDAQSQALKETLTLEGTDAPTALTFAITASDGLRARTTESGGLELVEGDDVVFAIDAPFAYPKGHPDAIHSLPTSLDRGEDGWRFKVDTGADWLRAALRDGAVVVDPTVNFPAPSQDCYLNQAAPTTSSCTAQELQVGASGGTQRNSLLQFNLSSIPKDSVVVNAKLGVYAFARANTTGKSVTAAPVKSAWTNSATWNTTNGSTSWATSGGDVADAPTGGSIFEVTNASVGSSLGWTHWYPTQTVQQWVAGTIENRGLLLKDAAGAAANLVKFTSSEGTDPNYRPFLDVAYWPRAGEMSGYTIDRQELTDRLNIGVNVANGNLLLRGQEINIPGTGLDFSADRTYNSNLDNEKWGKYGRAMTSSPFDICERNYDDGTVAITFGDGSVLPFYPKSGGGYTSPNGVDAHLEKSSTDFTYTLTFRRSWTKLHFNLSGTLDEIKDRYGNNITFTNFNGNGWAQTVTDTQGRVATVTYDANDQITDIDDWDGRNWHYTYGVAGNRQMTSSRDPEFETTYYEYDANNRLSKVTAPEGNVTLITYNSAGKVETVVRTTDTAHTSGPTTTYRYGAYNDTTYSSHVCSSAQQNKTVVIDPKGGGHKTTYCSNVRGEVLDVWDAHGHKQGNTFTPRGFVATYTAPENSSSQISASVSYNGDDSVTELKQGTGTGSSDNYKQSWTYGLTGTSPSLQYQPGTTTSPSNQTTTYEYDTGTGGLDKVRDGSPTSPAEIDLDRDSRGNITHAADGKGNTTDYSYDTLGRLQTVSPETVTAGTQIGQTTLTYDGLSRIDTVTDGLSHVTNYDYDDNDRTTNVGFSSNTGSAYAFDGNGNQLTRTDQLGSETFTYDALNRLTDQTENGRTTSYTYDLASNLETLTDAGGTVTYGYDDANLLTSVQEPGTPAPTTSITYDNDRRDVVTYPNGVTLDSNYDNASRLTRITGKKGTTVLTDFVYDYTAATALCGTGTAGNGELRQAVTDKDGNKTTYCYDQQDRLTRAQTKNSSGTTTEDIRYEYDKAGNITKRTDQAGATTYSHNQDNVLCWSVSGASTAGCGSPPTGARTYSHNTRGELTANSAGLSLSYNSRAQTNAVTPATGQPSTSLGYQGPNQTLLHDEGTTTLARNLLGIGRKRLSTGTSTYYTRDNRGGLLGLRLPSGDRDYYLTDGLGSIVAITNPSGNVAQSYKYDPYGRITTYDSAGNVTTSPAIDNPWRYTGAYHAPGGLVHNGMRWYDPQIGRWTQQDPLDQPSSLREANRYGYVGGDPVNHADPSGLCAFYEACERPDCDSTFNACSGRCVSYNQTPDQCARSGRGDFGRLVGTVYNLGVGCLEGAYVATSALPHPGSGVAGCLGGATISASGYQGPLQ